MVNVVYEGTDSAPFNIRGPASGISYRVRRGKPTPMHEADAKALTAHPLFRRA